MAVSYRPLVASDVEGLVSLLRRVRPAIARVSAMAVYRAVAKDSLRDPRAALIVADFQGQVVGYVLAVTDWTVFWRGFLLRHPLCAALIAFKRARVRLRPRTNPSGIPSKPEDRQYTSDLANNRSWSDSSSAIAKIVHVGIDSEFRERGFGSGLYREILKTMAARGIQRVDASIDSGNVHSLRMHFRTGWSIHRTRDGYFATIDLDPVADA